MSKHPVLYHQTVRQLALPACYVPQTTRNKPGHLPVFRQWYKVVLILCSIQLMHSFNTLHGGQNRWHFTSAAKAIPSDRSTATAPASTDPNDQFSFEYDGLVQFRIVIATNTGTGFFPAIHITTTLNQSDR